jgi:hypothetical protein
LSLSKSILASEFGSRNEFKSVPPNTLIESPAVAAQSEVMPSPVRIAGTVDDEPFVARPVWLE